MRQESLKETEQEHKVKSESNECVRTDEKKKDTMVWTYIM